MKTLLPKSARNLIAAACVLHILAYLQAVPAHLTDKDWPAHARFHVFQALLWIVGLDLALLLIALYPYARGERWASSSPSMYWDFCSESVGGRRCRPDAPPCPL